MAADFDFSEIDKLAADITDAADALPNIKKAVSVTAFKVKESWRDRLKGSDTLPALPYAINYDVKVAGDSVEAEIGFDKSKKQGALGNISEFGSINNPPRGFGLASLEENQGDFETGIHRAIDDTLKESGL